MLNQTILEFTVRVSHPNQERADYQIDVMRTLVGHITSQLHNANFHNGTVTITPIYEVKQIKKRKSKNASVS
jgi:hypothetical protein